MINLIKFKSYLSSGGGKSGPPVSISAKDLDDNFSALTPISDKFSLYKVDFTQGGYTIGFQSDGRPALWRELNLCVNGTPKKMKVLGTEPY